MVSSGNGHSTTFSFSAISRSQVPSTTPLSIDVASMSGDLKQEPTSTVKSRWIALSLESSSIQNALPDQLLKQRSLRRDMPGTGPEPGKYRRGIAVPNNSTENSLLDDVPSFASCILNEPSNITRSSDLDADGYVCSRVREMKKEACLVALKMEGLLKRESVSPALLEAGLLAYMKRNSDIRNGWLAVSKQLSLGNKPTSESLKKKIDQTVSYHADFRSRIKATLQYRSDETSRLEKFQNIYQKYLDNPRSCSHEEVKSYRTRFSYLLDANIYLEMDLLSREIAVVEVGEKILLELVCQRRHAVHEDRPILYQSRCLEASPSTTQIKSNELTSTKMPQVTVPVTTSILNLKAPHTTQSRRSFFLKKPNIKMQHIEWNFPPSDHGGKMFRLTMPATDRTSRPVSLAENRLPHPMCPRIFHKLIKVFQSKDSELSDIRLIATHP